MFVINKFNENISTGLPFAEVFFVEYTNAINSNETR